MVPKVNAVENSGSRPARVDAVVIGGGIIGVTTALCLAERGLLVMLCEKGVIAGEQSGRTLGWCRTLGRDLRELGLMIESMRLWEAMSERVGADVGFRKCGVMYVCDSEQEIEKYAKWLESARDFQVRANILSADEAASLLPGAVHRWRGVVHAPFDGCAEPQAAAPTIAAAAARHGAIISQQDAVREIERTAGRISAVVTEKGRVACDIAIVTGGVWSSAFCANLGIRLPQLAVKASVLKTAPVDGPTYSLSGSGFITRRRADGGYNVLRYGGETHEIVPDSFRFLRDFREIARSEARVKLRVGRGFFAKQAWRRSWRGDRATIFETARELDPPPDRRSLEQGLAALARAFPLFKGIEVQNEWAGSIDVTPDALPVISTVDSWPGLVLSTGFSGHGFGIGPSAGRLTADVAMGRGAATEASAFSLSRFDGNPVRPGPAL